MKVLHLISVLAPSGAEQSTMAMAPILAELGVDLEVAYLHERPGAKEFLTRVGLPATSLVGGGGPVARFARTLNLVRSLQPDLIHTSLTEANLLGRAIGTISRIPVVSSLVNVSYGPEQLDAPDRSRLSIRVRHGADIATARLVTRFHAVTHEVADVMAPRLHVPRSRIEVVPRGRSAEALGCRSPERRQRTREALGIRPGTVMVLAAARQEYQKGLDVLIEAMPSVLRAKPDVRLIVAGRTGLHTPVLQGAVERLRLSEGVEFLGLR
ncbi:MAG: glycosyltransferase family 4 protein, partial [Pseudonocardiaceae bacterium]